MSLLREFYVPFEGLDPGMVGLEGCGSLLTHLETRKVVLSKYLVRHSLSTQQALEEGDLQSAH